MRALFTTIAAVLVVISAPAMSGPIKTASEAVAYLLDQEIVPHRETTRIYEVAESIRPGVHRWRVSFMSKSEVIDVKIDTDRETEVLNKFDDPSFYSASFVDRLPEPRKTPSGEKFLERAKTLVRAANPKATIEPGHISHYKICLPPSDGKASRHENGCSRRQPFEHWRVYLKVTPPTGDWYVRKISFADDKKPVLSDGPRGFFE